MKKGPFPHPRLFVFHIFRYVAKLSKKAFTERCPVCDEEIPLRLLGVHLDLETDRLEGLIASIGKDVDPSILLPADDEPR